MLQQHVFTEADPPQVLSGSGGVGPPIALYQVEQSHYVSSPHLLFLAFSDFLAFFFSFFFKEFHAILSVFPFFPKDFRGSASIGNARFFWWFSLPFSKRARKEDQGTRSTLVPYRATWETANGGGGGKTYRAILGGGGGGIVQKSAPSKPAETLREVRGDGALNVSEGNVCESANRALVSVLRQGDFSTTLNCL